MPAPSIDYLNARRALMPASGGKKYSRTVKYDPAGADFVTLKTEGFRFLKYWVESRKQRNVVLDDMIF